MTCCVKKIIFPDARSEHSIFSSSVVFGMLYGIIINLNGITNIDSNGYTLVGYYLGLEWPKITFLRFILVQ